ncbi:methyltransferase domain-containing protein [Armatimonas sp.]|uniref:class I SAM-dependent methyltransferase n=1 Tax=Armatimonas sp. TaxID=1872638 RepID=UPI00286A70AC|nr:methyltransferase domain-containing protein [Armatimonas sp.]
MLLDDNSLTRSSVVANSTMNRERGLSGANSYAKDLGFAPLEWLEARRPARWLDLCCGSGRALIEAAGLCTEQGIEIVGVDLVGLFADGAEAFPHLRLIESPAGECALEGPFELITCVHGLHYLGDKLGILAQYATLLSETGRLVGHLDLDNIQGVERRTLLTLLRNHGWRYDSRRHLIEGTAKSQPLPLEYLGAEDRDAPNFTGQPGVNSYYKPAIF